jgi:hypothetical protein
MHRLLLALPLTGCIAIAGPPLHGKLGATRYSERLDTGKHNPDSFAAAELGLDTAPLLEAPVTVGGGVLTEVARSGSYLEVGWITRAFEDNVRIGATTGAEWFWAGDHGKGVRAGLTFEFAGPHVHDVGTEHDPNGDGNKNDSVEARAEVGAWSVGAFVDGSRRWLDGQPDVWAITFGLSFRLPAFALAVNSEP